MQVIKDVKVKGISLVSNKHTPAVPLATHDYAIFKMFGGVSVEKSQDTPTSVPLEKDIVKKLEDAIVALRS